MMKAFQVILIATYALCGFGIIADNESKLHVVTMGISGVLFLLSIVAETVVK